MSDHKRIDQRTNQGFSFALRAVVCLSLLSSSAAFAGTGAPSFRSPFDFDQSGTSDVLLMKVSSPPNVGINETDMTSGTTFTARGWPDLNTSASGVEYTTLSAGVFDGNANDQAQILTRKTSGANIGLIRIVKLETDGFTRSTPGQFFVGGSDGNWSFVGVGDCDGNGTDDIVLYQTTGQNPGLVRIILMNPATFTPLATVHPGTLAAENTPVGVGDADGDGQADVWTLDTNTQGIEVLIQSPTVASGGAFESAQMPTSLPATYQVSGLGIFNPGDLQTDIVFEKISGPNTGLIRIDHPGTGGGSSGAPPVVFPALLDQAIGEQLASVGNYDDLNQFDLLTRMFTPVNAANNGALTVRLMNAAGDDTTASGSPTNWSNPLSFTVINGAP